MIPERPWRRTGPGALLALSALLGIAPPGALQETREPLLGAGITERIVCAADPDQSYALFLPPAYDPSRPSPVLFLLDAGGRAMAPIERFRKGAARSGFILASSYNSASDEPAGDPNLKALNALWKDAASRLNLDRGRSYVAGFSGTARAAFGMALASPGKIAGVVAAGAGFPEDLSPTKGAPFLIFGTVGEEDFNYYEMIDLDRLLEKLGLPHRIEVFAGGHDWMPEELAGEALEWLLLMGPPSDDPDRDAALAGSFWIRGMERARRLEEEGNLLEALRSYRSLERDFRGRRDVSEAAEAVLRIQGSEAGKRMQREWEERRAREKRALEEAWRILGAAFHSSDAPAQPAKIAGELGIAGWKKKAAGSGAEASAARRVLSTLSAQTAFYLPREEEGKGNFKGAALLLAVAEAIHPGSPVIAYRLAADLARSGDTGEALRALERAVKAGFDDLARLRGDPAFDKMRGSPRYARIEEELARRRNGPASGKP